MPDHEGRYVWHIPDAYLGSANQGGQPCSHEAICVLNAGDRPARLRFTFFFADREPVGPVEVTVGARRCNHLRTDQPERWGGYAIPRDTPYGIRLESDVPVSVQYSRLDVSQPNYALMTAIPYYV